MSFKAAVFDLDGTLIDTLLDIANSANSALAKYGFPPHGIDEYRYFIGDGATMLISRALPAEKRIDAIISDCVKAFHETYSLNWNVNTKPYDGVMEVLDELTAKQVKMAILSNKPDDFTKLCVRELLPGKRFEIVLGQKEGIPMKPDPAGANKIADILSIAPSQFLYLGDSGIDMQTATGAGMFAVGALWGFRSREELMTHGAQVMIERPMQFLDIFENQ